MLGPGSKGLNSTNVNNRSSALPHLEDVQGYMDKEVSLGAMLGPGRELGTEEVNCPKYLDKRIVILDLS